MSNNRDLAKDKYPSKIVTAAPIDPVSASLRVAS
jgi:hypothetical protein